ncbi:hypothetical protein ACCO45_012718 [Purpureocillium lilacinum]|uniref:Uncharacterized protein n=1 Tax=Purpureocillium lilacinum TaxID=33203 RepID=A0ACC4DBV7_PURLI
MSSWPSTSAAETGVLRAGDEWQCAARTIHINQAGLPAGLRHQALLIATGDAPSSVQVPTVVTTAADPAELPSSPKKRRGSSTGGIARTTTRPLPQPATQGQSYAKLPKRPKADEQQPKTLPLRYELCAVEDLVDMMAYMLGELIEMNDAIGLSSGSLTRFHSRSVPGITVATYLHRLATHATLTPPLLLAMVYYIDRLCAMYREFNINSLTVHRFLITAATVAAKGLSDAFLSNMNYARVGGVRVAELKLLELEFLSRVEWRIVPDPEVLVAYYRGLVERTPGYELRSDQS